MGKASGWKSCIMHYALCIGTALCIVPAISAQRTKVTLSDGWQFREGGDALAPRTVRAPHDWAIYGPFDRANDLQTVAIEQNGESVATVKTGRTGGLPFIGSGVYTTTFEVADTADKSVTLVFDGVMSNAQVRVNGRHVIAWPYGYNSFYACIDSVVTPGVNTLEVNCCNKEGQSRWYPGAGIYRNVHVITTSRVHIPVWGTYVTTPTVNADRATVRLRLDIEGARQFEPWPYGEKVTVSTAILDPDGKEVARESTVYTARGQELTQNFTVPSPRLWDLKTPNLYTARTTLSVDGEEVDTYQTRFGIRTLEYVPDEGFYLNGRRVKFRGVCNHHDLGPLGAAVNRSALRHQIEMLKDMGVNAIRTSHNMPAPELVELCDEMGMMLMVEPFDDWGFRPKSPNGYGAVFNEWAQRDITNMVRHYRNSPSVVMWSIGNEVPSQWGPPGIEELTMLQNLVHQLDPTRPVTCGMDQINAVLEVGFAAALDIPGFNYKPQYYDSIHAMLPQRLVLGSETASTVSSRGVYHFPVVFPGADGRNVVMHPGKQSSGYDVESCSWSNTPDIDLAADEDLPYLLGQFIWTGFDYLGEPAPYDTDAWPSHSSYFGAIDLASLPKDRYYLYRSVWNDCSPTLHILPHWSWAGREGEVTPVMVYTSYPKAELFINDVSQGVRSKNDSTLQNRFRLMWMDTRYEPGELRVVAYDTDGNAAAEKTVRTPGNEHHLVLTKAFDSDDLVYVTVTVADRDGNPVPTASDLVSFKVSGGGTFEATANGDATCVLPMREPRMNLFSGACTVIVRRTTDAPVTLKVTAPGLKGAGLSF